MPTTSKTRKPKAGRARTATKKPIASKSTPKRAIRTTRTASGNRATITTATPAEGSKQRRMITMLSAEGGASMDQLTKATGWQAHTVRATISAMLRRRLGLNVESMSTGEGTARTYRIVGQASA